MQNKSLLVKTTGDKNAVYKIADGDTPTQAIMRIVRAGGIWADGKSYFPWHSIIQIEVIE